MGSPVTLQQDNLVANFSPKPEFVIKKIIVEIDFIYTPAQPITINDKNYSQTLLLSQFKNRADFQASCRMAPYL
jgi:hypothetical protein